MYHSNTIHSQEYKKMNVKEEKKEFDLKKSIDMKAKIKKLDNMIKMVCNFS